MQKKAGSGFSRRALLQRVGMVAGALAVATPLQVGAAPQRPQMGVGAHWRATTPLRIGLLTSPSARYPEMGANLLAGMQLYLQQWSSQARGQSASVTPAVVGVGGSQAFDQARAWLESGSVDLVVGILNKSVALQLHPLFEQHGRFLVVSNVGANMARPEASAPFLLHSNLSYWEANWAMGAWAAANLGARAMLVTSLFESGYDAPYAFRLGFEGAGGSIMESMVSHIPGAQHGLPTILEKIRELKPDFVYAMASGQEAIDFVQGYAEAGLAGTIPLAGSAFLMDEALLPAMGHAAQGIKSCMPWAPALSTAENLDFTRAYQTQTGRRADALAVLGYDTARIIAQAFNETSGDLSQADRFREAFHTTHFASPRGPLHVTPTSTNTPLYVREVQEVRGGVVNRVIAQLEVPSNVDNQGRSELLASLQTGWLNPYLCA